MAKNERLTAQAHGHMFRNMVEGLIEEGLQQTPQAVAYRTRCQAAIVAALKLLPEDGPGLTPEEVRAIIRDVTFPT